MVYHSLRTGFLAVAGLAILLAACSKAEPGGTKSSSVPVEKAGLQSPLSRNSAENAAAISAPRIVKLTLTPAHPRPGDELTVQVEAAPDAGEPVEFRYQWSVNEERIVAEDGPRFRCSFKKGDRIKVMITPERAGVEGSPLSQTAVIGNSPPIVKSELVDVKVIENKYSCRVQAEDPDGDALTFSLLKGTKGMTIDSKAGVITGEYQQDDAGLHTLSISVKDTDNAEVVLDVPFRMEYGK